MGANTVYDRDEWMGASNYEGELFTAFSKQVPFHVDVLCPEDGIQKSHETMNGMNI